MFSKTSMQESTSISSGKVARLKKALDAADSVVIGAGALSNIPFGA